MSAECGKCGFDIVYPPGTWPVGECLNCKRADEIERLRAALTKIRMLTVEVGDSVEAATLACDVAMEALGER